MRKRLAACLREAKLGAHHTPALSDLGLGVGAADLYPVVVAERRADRGQGALGHHERVAHRPVAAAVEQHPHGARAGVKPAADEPPDTGKLSGATQHAVKRRRE